MSLTKRKIAKSLINSTLIDLKEIKENLNNSFLKNEEEELQILSSLVEICEIKIELIIFLISETLLEEEK